MMEQVPTQGWNSTTLQHKKEPLSSTTRGWNPTTPQCKKYLHSGGQTHNNNKGTSKRKKRTEKAPILRYMFLHIKRKTSPLHPAPFQICSGLIKKPNVDGETCTTVLSVLFLVWFQPQKIFISL